MNDHVHIVGAGFAGLSLALKLVEKGLTVEIHERADRVGGLLGTERTSYGLSEQAANAFICNEKTETLFAQLELEPVRPLKSAKKRFIFRDEPRRWPLNFVESLRLIWNFLPVFILSRDRLRPHREETLHSWGLKNLGPDATRYILGPAMQGIYASSAEHLSSKLILGSVFRPKDKLKKTQGYKGLLTGTAGMQEIIDALEKKLLSRGVQFHFKTQVDLEKLQGKVVIATSCKSAADLLQNVRPSVAQELRKISMASVLSVKLFFKTPQTNYKGFGCLVPRYFGMKTLGVLMNSYIFPYRDQFYNETWILGGPEAETLHAASDSEILKLIAEERFRILKSRDPILDYRIHRWTQALPLYNLELEKVLANLKEQSLSRFYLHGNYLGGIGLSKILERSEDLAQELASHV